MRPDSVGQVVTSNVLAGGFAGPVIAINPHHIDIACATWVAAVGDLQAAPDLAIVMTATDIVPDVINELGKKGTRAAVVITAGITGPLRQAMLDAAKPHLLRIVGPNCVGILMPHARLNASFAAGGAPPGNIALISQSGALVTAMIDGASARAIGFSGIVSVGDMADVDLGDLIALFAADPNTDAILMYVEGVTNAAKFMAAARAASRLKPVIAIKAGRNAAAGKAAMSHTGALAGAFDVYRAAFRRAGIVMVDTFAELIDAAEVLSKVRDTAGDRLAIVTNGGGAGVLAVDALSESGGQLATLDRGTMSALDASLPPNWSHGDPVDIIGDAHADRYQRAVDAVLRDDAVDALLVMNCPTALTPPVETATAVAGTVRAARAAGIAKPVLACWLGDRNCASARPILTEEQIPVFSTPEDAVRGFGYLLEVQRARDAATISTNTGAVPSRTGEAIHAILKKARADGRTVLNEVEAKALLATSNIPVVPTRVAASVDAVADACRDLSAPFAVKIISPQITHKSDVGGVALNLPDPEAATAAARAMAQRIAASRPDAMITGFAVEAMIARQHAHELIVGIADDPTFGPLILVGAGGKAVEVLRDRALGLPPLDDTQMRTMIGETRISRLLTGYRDEPAADIDALVAVISALSALAVDFPDIVELDINPLLIDPTGAIALDGRIRITLQADPPPRLVMTPAAHATSIASAPSPVAMAATASAA